MQGGSWEILHGDGQRFWWETILWRVHGWGDSSGETVQINGLEWWWQHNKGGDKSQSNDKKNN